MNKREILEKSRIENNSKDLVKQDIYKTATLVGTTVGWFFIAFILISTGIIANKTNFGALSILFSIESGMFLTQYIKMKKTHDLVVSIIYIIATISVSVLFVLQLIGII